MMDGYDGIGWGAVLVMCTVMAVILVGGAVWLLALLRGQDRERPEPDPRHVLDARLARGEISEEEYLSARSALNT